MTDFEAVKVVSHLKQHHLKEKIINSRSSLNQAHDAEMLVDFVMVMVENSKSKEYIKEQLKDRKYQK
jgi:hypothetical protein